MNIWSLQNSTEIRLELSEVLFSKIWALLIVITWVHTDELPHLTLSWTLALQTNNFVPAAVEHPEYLSLLPKWSYKNFNFYVTGLHWNAPFVCITLVTTNISFIYKVVS